MDLQTVPDVTASFAQQRLWFLDQLTQGSGDYLLPLAIRLRGELDPARLRAALTGIAHRHAVLRTRFVAADGRPVPHIDPPGEIAWTQTSVAGPDELFERELSRPIDLATEHPMRTTLARVGPGEHVLLLVVHHIAVDGWSWDVLLRELGAGYAGEPVAPPAVSYAEVGRDQQARLTDERMRQLLGHWQDRLAGVPPLDLPTDRPRPPFFDGAGDVVRFRLPAEVVSEVDRVARQCRATRYMLLLAVYQALLGRYAGQDDVAVCTTMADRGRPDVADLIGPFVNTVVLRTDLAAPRTFAELVRQVRTTVLTDLSHGEAPFDRVVGAVGADRDLSRHPLAQASFTLLNTAHRPPRLAGLRAELIPSPLPGAPMDVFLDLNLMPDGSIAGRLQYATALFDAATMHRFAGAYQQLLRAALAEPSAPTSDLLGAIEPLSGRDSTDRTETWSSSGTDPVVAPLTVRGEPAAPALICGEQTVSYRDLDRLVEGLAARMRPAGVVGLATSRGVWSVIGLLAAWRAGAAAVPLDRDLPAERLRYMKAEAGVQLVVDDALVASVTPADPQPVAPPHPQSLAYVIFTSGSTGRPKAVGVPHGAVASHAAAARHRFGITVADRVLAFSAFSFDASLDQLLPALTTGATVVIRPDEPWAPARIPAVVAEHGITVLNLPPTFWSELASGLTASAVADLSRVRLLLLGGETVPAGALAAWQEHLPAVRVLNAYGPTETTVTATTYEIPGPAGGPVPIGRPLGGRRVYVVDAHGDRVPVGAPGELMIGGPELARGYLGRPGLTADRFVPDPFGPPGSRLYRTGDVVRWRPTGDLEFRGRADDQVKIRGFRIELGEVEAVLREHPAVDAAAVAVHPDAHGGPALVGYVVPAGDPAALRAWCAERLPHYAVPSDVVALAELPVTSSGKLDRAALPAPGRNRTAAGRDYVTPRDDTERVIAQIWAQVLGVDRVGIDDSFFDLGGHSLLATMAVSRTAAALGRDLDLRAVFENPRIREYAPIAGAARTAGSTGVVPVDRSGPLPLSFAQERIWFLDRMSELGEEYLLWYSWRVRGGLDRAAWQAALDDVAERHEVLRTALTEVDGRPAQLVRSGVTVPLDWHHAPGDLDEVRRAATELATRRFDLAAPPMLRSGVWELAPDDHVAVVAFHHVATDGWSKDLLLRDLSESYQAHLAGSPASLPPLPVQYGDFAVWQRGPAAADLVDRQVDWWRTVLAGLPTLALPTDRPRPRVWSGRGAAVEVPLPVGVATGVDALTARYGVTRFLVLLAVVQVALARWSGQDDVPVGTPVAGRTRVELEQLVGFFVNTVVLRGDLAGEPTFAEVLDRLRDRVLGAFDHQDVPFERLVRELRPERDLSRNPLFQVMFDVQESAVPAPRVAGLAAETFPLRWGSAKFDLTITFLCYPDRFALSVEYATDLYDEDTVRRFADRVGRVLTAVLTDPVAPVARIDLLGATERTDLLAAAGSAAPDVTPFAVAGAPQDPAVVCAGQSLSYAELDELTGSLAAALGPDRSGEPIGVCLRRGVRSVAAMLAVWRAGGVYVPLDPALPADRLRYMVTEAGVTRVIGDATTATVTAGLGVPAVDAGAVTPARGPAPATPRPDDLAYVIFTSGSTGRPKAVGVTHAALGAHVAAARDLFGLTAADRVLAFASLSFDASLEQILPALSVGARVVLRPDELWSVAELADHVRAEGVTVMELAPAYWVEVVARLDTVVERLRGLRLLVTGGEALPAAPLQAWFEQVGVPVVNTYGPTEATISATAHVVTAATATTGVTVPIGAPLAGRRAYVTDRHGELVPAGVPGELMLGGDALARGYLGRPGLTADRFGPDPYGPPGARMYRTGDVVRRLPGGALEFLGRTDNQVKIRGFRIEPGEIETVLRDHPGVRAAAVVVRELSGDRALVAYVVADEPDTAALDAWCRTRLPDYLVPAAFVPLEALPMTVQGKLDPAALPDPVVPVATDFTDPRNPTEIVVAQIWAEALGLPRVSVHDDFFALGGHSLRAVAVAARLRAAFDYPAQVRDIFEHPTVELLAREVERQLVEQIYAMSDDEIDLSLTADPN